jgi:asparagine synthase (glutamine-hydrolysing)
MSVQFGRCNFDGKPVDREYVAKVTAVVSPYAPDDVGSYSGGDTSIIYSAFHTTKESRRETQPHISSAGLVLTWDGRLDNRSDLIRELRYDLVQGATDVAIVAAAYQKWGNKCFAWLIGDWALSVWDTNTRSLILAKDPIGTRHLYYSIGQNLATWSTVLDTLVLFSGKTFSLCEEYIAGWLSFFPATHLTPYVGIYAVPASCSVLIQTGKHIVSKYWDFDPGKRIRYKSDAEYEEHFRTVFGLAVSRRLHSDSPILAELSGGMDSSSIVCMADTVIARGATEAPRLDTLSYYNDSEPNWNERPYFTKVEEKRGRIGCHIDVDSENLLPCELETDRFVATPNSGSGNPSKAGRQFNDCLASNGNRVVLSGIGGDEVMGGIPTPTPELQDLVAKAQFGALTHQLKLWALNKRKPWFYLLHEAVRGFLPLSSIIVPKTKRPAHWLSPDFVERNHKALQGYDSRIKLFGPLPSFQDNVTTLEALRRQVACSPLPSEPAYEKRYPFLDRDLLEFMYAIPREQLVRPGHRRSLMRRALVGIVPDELLNRRRKAFLARTPMTAISKEWPGLVQLSERMICSSLAIVNPRQFSEALQRARNGQEVAMITLMRTLATELWLRTLDHRGLLSGLTDGSRNPSALGRISAPTFHILRKSSPSQLSE